MVGRALTAPAALALALSSCGSPPGDACPGGHAGQPGCAEAVARWQGEGCPPSSMAPEVSWGEPAEAPLVSASPALALGDELAVVSTIDSSMHFWSKSAGWRTEHLPCATFDHPLARPMFAVDEPTGDFYLVCSTFSDPFSVTARNLWVRRASTGAWHPIAPPPLDLYAATALVHDRKFLLFGGVSPDEPAGRDRVLVYALDNGDNGPWTELPPMPERRSFAQGAQVGSFYYLTGGMTFQQEPRVMAYSTLIYDLTSGTWSSGAPLPTPRHSHELVAHCDLLLAIGGLTSQTFPVASTEVLDPITRSWLPAPGASVPQGDGLPGAAVLDGQLHTVVATGVGRGHRTGTITGWTR